MGAVIDTVLGRSIPPDTPHAVSVSLPTWSSNVGYEEGKDWVVSKMSTGYPRFFIQKSITDLADLMLRNFGSVGESTMLFPSIRSANRCIKFLELQSKKSLENQARAVMLLPAVDERAHPRIVRTLRLAVLFFPSSLVKLAKTFWQHTGEGISSRQAHYCRKLFEEGLLVEKQIETRPGMACKGPKRYQKYESTAERSINHKTDLQSHDSGNTESVKTSDDAKFVEERFGRNLNLDMAELAKKAICRRVIGSLTANIELRQTEDMHNDTSNCREIDGLTDDDVYLYSGGMSSIFNTHQIMLSALGHFQSICFGFPYLDTLKVLEKFGPGCLFYGHGLETDLDDLEMRLKNGHKFLTLFCEVPSNPLLKTPNLQRIRKLANTYGFAVVIDETIGNYLNVHTLEYADILVSSLTKIFSGDGNVMGGCAVLNPQSAYYKILKQKWNEAFDDNYWPEDAIYMERNSRDFASRIYGINRNAEAICDLLQAHPKIKRVYYPKVNDSRIFYDQCKTSAGGYGGLLSATFHSLHDAEQFYDNLNTEKGPSLGTNFTLASPFVILAHFNELEWVGTNGNQEVIIYLQFTDQAAQYGVEAALVRFSVGLEDTEYLCNMFASALAAMGS